MSVPGISLPDDRYRRLAGSGLGALVGVTYAAAYQVGDRIALPGVPLYQPPFGLAGNLLVFALAGGVLGLIAAWLRNGIAGTFLAAAVSAVAVVGSAYISMGTTRENLLVNVFNAIFLALPFWGLLVLMIGPLRWVVSHEEEARRDRQPLRRRALRPLILVLVVGLAGLTALYPGDARALVRRTDEMLKTAQATSSVPQPLANTAFATRGQGPYRLSWERDRIERYRIPASGGKSRSKFCCRGTLRQRVERGLSLCQSGRSAQVPGHGGYSALRDSKSDVSTWERATTIDQRAVVERERDRLRIGIILGAALGLAYGLVSQLINRIAVPGIPLYQPPAGPFGNIAFSTIVGAGLAALTCYPASAALGVLFGGAASLAGILVYMLIRLGDLGLGGALISGVIFSVPMAWLTVPLLAFIRWAAERQAEARRVGEPALRRLLLPLVSVLVTVFVASFELLPDQGRDNLVRTNTLIQQGLQAASAAQLPEPLRGPYMTVFPPSQPESYTLEWTKYDLDRFNELRPPSNFDQHAAVIARFPSSYYLVCLYPTPKGAPNCANYDRMPAKAPQRRDQ